MDNSRCGFNWVPRLLAIVIALKARRGANRRVVLRPTFAKLSGGTRKVGSKAPRFDDRDLYAERSDFFGQRF
jgi:hypothetical protein